MRDDRVVKKFRTVNGNSMVDKNFIKAAASIVLVRNEGNYRSVLMGKRGLQASFMPGKYVFPGGAFDESDSFVPSARPLANGCSSLLKLQSTKTLAHGLPFTAVRELWEETGLRLACKYNITADIPKDWSNFFLEGLAPDLSGLVFFFRAITPPGRTRRFDARFFLCDAKNIFGNCEDFSDASAELSDLQWVPLENIVNFPTPRITKTVLKEVELIIARGANSLGIPFFRGGSEIITKEFLKNS